MTDFKPGDRVIYVRPYSFSNTDAPGTVLAPTSDTPPDYVHVQFDKHLDNCNINPVNIKKDRLAYSPVGKVSNETIDVIETLEAAVNDRHPLWSVKRCRDGSVYAETDARNPSADHADIASALRWLLTQDPVPPTPKPTTLNPFKKGDRIRYTGNITSTPYRYINALGTVLSASPATGNIDVEFDNPPDNADGPTSKNWYVQASRCVPC